MIKPSPKTNNNNLNLQRPLPNETNRWVNFGKDSLDKFAAEVVSLAIAGWDVNTMMNEMIERNTPFVYCDNEKGQSDMEAVPDAKVMTELKSVSTSFFIKLRTISMTNPQKTEGLSQNKDMCEIFTNSNDALNSFNLLEKHISDNMIKTTRATQQQNYLMLGVMMVVFFIFTEPFLVYYLYMTFAELNKLISIMHQVNDAVKKEASKPLRRDLPQSNDVFHQEPRGESINKGVYYGMLAIPVLFGLGIIVAVVLLAESHNQNFLQLNQWLYYGIMRGSYIHEAFVYAFLTAAINQGHVSPKFITEKRAASLARECIGTLLSYNNILLRGTEGLEPCVGQNERLDMIHLQDDCHGQADLGAFHDTYRCSSLDRSVTLFSTFVNDIISKPEKVEFVHDKLIYHMYHIMNSHMIDITYEAAGILSTLADQLIVTVQEQLSGLCFGGLAIITVGFIVFMMLIERLQIAFDGALQMMLRLPPLSITQQPDLFNFLMHKEAEKTAQKMSTANSVVYLANDAIFFLNRQESIEVVNKAVPLMLGYTPEQLLGQPFSTVIPQEEGPKVFETFNLMRNGQSGLIVEQDCNAMTDSDVPMPVHVTILGISDGSSNGTAKSFVVIVRSETDLIEQRKKAEDAKAASENLLFQILPRDIVTRLNAGESDISIVVPSATVIFIDIQKFSEYAANLAPSQIMENLSLIFAKFDEICAKFPLITKIKLIGDVYMAAAGLFNPEESPTAHAQQTVQFALEVLQGLEDVNAQLNSSLQVRIGVNTDGPLIAGVLGTDKPVFDIIGDPINVAARLQSNGIPGTVQISQGTYDAIKDLNFHVEQRGLLELKGKGKKMAYIVRGIDTGSFFSRSRDENL